MPMKGTAVSTPEVDPAVLEAQLAEARKAAEANWGKYVAAGPIYLGGARAFNEGDPVPVSHVESGVVDLSEVTEVTEPVSEPPATAVPEVPIPEVPAAVEEV